MNLLYMMLGVMLAGYPNRNVPGEKNIPGTMTSAERYQLGLNAKLRSRQWYESFEVALKKESFRE